MLEINCRYIKRKKNISKNISSYDNKILEIKKRYENFEKNNEIYVAYNFKIRGKEKCIDYRIEGILNTILKRYITG